ncbi:hypothetical protein BGW80DRAFT_1333299 [Lactifluus volemus]|nr:hypothetical protein BGW80DRAFT_1333299 [Lactifluus volemus]
MIRCQKALLATGNSDDPDIDAPIAGTQSSASSGAATAAGRGPDPSPEQIAILVDMGFSTSQARKALRETSGDPERAIEWLFSHPDDLARYRLRAFVSHKGPSVHSGHYVAHIRTERDGMIAGYSSMTKRLSGGR